MMIQLGKMKILIASTVAYPIKERFKDVFRWMKVMHLISPETGVLPLSKRQVILFLSFFCRISTAWARSISRYAENSIANLSTWEKKVPVSILGLLIRL